MKRENIRKVREVSNGIKQIRELQAAEAVLMKTVIEKVKEITESEGETEESQGLLKALQKLEQ
ncbi:MAG: hypothetical protein DBY05_06760 [Clostridiales bacterium]|jgi:precorrin isomerase|nr:MAG: hypothetical protein DBY05_06760 [Clostridiales bacterium]